MHNIYINFNLKNKDIITKKYIDLICTNFNNYFNFSVVVNL